MMRAAEARGHQVFAIDCATLGWRGGETGHAGGVFAMAARLQLRREAGPLAGKRTTTTGTGPVIGNGSR